MHCIISDIINASTLLIMTYVCQFDHVPSNDLPKALLTHALFLILSSLDRYVRARPLAQVTLNTTQATSTLHIFFLQQLALTSAKPEQQRLSFRLWVSAK